MEQILLKNINKTNSHDIFVYAAGGGYQALRKALSLKPEDILNEVKQSR